MYWPGAGRGTITLRADLRSDIPIITVDDHVNAISFADRVADEFLKLMNRASA